MTRYYITTPDQFVLGKPESIFIANLQFRPDIFTVLRIRRLHVRIVSGALGRVSAFRKALTSGKELKRAR